MIPHVPVSFQGVAPRIQATRSREEAEALAREILQPSPRASKGLPALPALLSIPCAAPSRYWPS